GRFREDLYYRLNVHMLNVPPLRDRRSDVPELAEHFLTLICRRFGIRKKRFTPEAMDMLMAHDWQRNNVRELRNIVERMIIASDDDIIPAEEVPIDVQGAVVPAHVEGARTFQQRKTEAERQIIISALERNEWHISNTAKDLGLADHASLLKIMRRLHVKRA
ncbi:MAG: helix-turn-helix domain-containing protein, partial [Rhodothermales bacterium]